MDVVGFPLRPMYVSGTYAEANATDDGWQFVDEQEPRPVITTRWKHVLEIGARAEAVIAAGASVSHASDPAVVAGLTLPSGATVDEIVVYHTGTKQRILPSSIRINSGNITLYIPRARLVKPSLEDNAVQGLEYADTNNFVTSVDVNRIYTDPSVNAKIISSHDCSSSCSANGCTEYTETACLTIRNARLGILDMRYANYTGGTWRQRAPRYRNPRKVQLYYKAGAVKPTNRLVSSIIRLAHVLMPEEPCACPTVSNLWKKDNNVPQVLTAERLNCPFGISDGAWIAYETADHMQIGGMSVW